MEIEKIEKVLREMHHRPRELARAQLEDLMALTRHSEERIRSRAFDALVARQDIAVVEPLSADLRNQELRPAFRAAQAARLGRLGLAIAEPVLLDVLSHSNDNLVCLGVARALARVGTNAALSALENAARSDSPALAQVAAFAHFVISHRLGRVSFRSPLEGAQQRIPLVGVAAPIASQTVPPANVRILIDALGGELYGLGPRVGPALEISCPAGRRTVLLNADIAVTPPAITLRRRPMLLGVVLAHFAEDDTWATSLVLLGGPADEGLVYVAAFRQDGLIAHLGTGQATESTLTVDIAALNIPGNYALNVRAYAHGTSIGFSGFVGAMKVAPRRPAAITPPK